MASCNVFMILQDMFQEANLCARIMCVILH